MKRVHENSLNHPTAMRNAYRSIQALKGAGLPPSQEPCLPLGGSQGHLPYAILN